MFVHVKNCVIVSKGLLLAIFLQTNSAYMLFYERCPPKTKEQLEKEEEIQEKEPPKKFNFELSKELEQVQLHV